MGWQPKAPPLIHPADPMRQLVRELRSIDRSGRAVSRREWWRLARRFVRCKSFIRDGRVSYPPPSRPVR